jgi:hypothetical protein
VDARYLDHRGRCRGIRRRIAVRRVPLRRRPHPRERRRDRGRRR